MYFLKKLILPGNSTLAVISDIVSEYLFFTISFSVQHMCLWKVSQQEKIKQLTTLSFWDLRHHCIKYHVLYKHI